MKVNLSVEEARLLAVNKAVSRFSEFTLIPKEDVSILATYLPAVFDNLEQLEKTASEKELAVYLDGYIAGFAANRLISAGIKPSDLEQVRAEDIEAPQLHAAKYQSGVNPDGSVRT